MKTSVVQKFKGIFKDDLFMQSGIIFLGIGAGHFFQLLFHLVSVRLLTPQQYGDFNALASFVLIFAFLGSPTHTTFVWFFTQKITQQDFYSLNTLFRLSFNRIAVCSGALFLLIGISASRIAYFLKTEYSFIMLCAAIVFVSLLSIPFVSLIQGFQKFKTISAIWIISSFLKLLSGVVLIYLGFGVSGGLAGFLVGPLVIIALTAKTLNSISILKNPEKIHDASQARMTPLYKFILPASIAMFSFAIISNSDIVLVKHFFSPLQAGYYSIAQIGGKIALLFPLSLSIVLSPKSTQAHTKNLNSLPLLYKSLLCGAICASLMIAVSFLFPRKILTLLTTHAHFSSYSLLGFFVTAMGFYALLWIVINYALAVYSFGFVAPLAFLSIAQTICMYLFHPTLLSVVLILLFFSIISFLTIFPLVVFNEKKNMVQAKKRIPTQNANV